MNKLYRYVLPEHSWALLEKLMQEQKLNNFYLAGGTALALQLGTRISIDLDFFTPDEFKANLLDGYKFETVIGKSDNSIEGIVSETKVFLFYFAYPQNKQIKTIEGIRLADPVDIGLMKLLALQGRTTKKDIIDLYYIDKKVIKLEELLELFENFYPKESFNSYQSFKNLINLEQIESQPMPKLYDPIEWEVALETVQTKLSKHIKSLLNL